MPFDLHQRPPRGYHKIVYDPQYWRRQRENPPTQQPPRSLTPTELAALAFDAGQPAVSGNLRERWAFCDDEIPENCSGRDLFCYTVDGVEVCIYRSGTVTPPDQERTGIQSIICNDDEHLERLGDGCLSTVWRNVICDREGRFISFA